MDLGRSKDVENELCATWTDFTRDLLSQDADAIEWTRLEQIVAVLNRLACELPGVHWAFLPRGGGLEIAHASISSEPDCIQVESRSGDVYVCRPRSLRCNAIPVEPHFAYLDLQLERLRTRDEEIVRSDLKEDWRGKILGPDGTEKYGNYTRLLNGWVFICCRVCYREDYDGHYDELTRNQFRRVVRHGFYNGLF